MSTLELIKLAKEDVKPGSKLVRAGSALAGAAGGNRGAYALLKRVKIGGKPLRLSTRLAGEIAGLLGGGAGGYSAAKAIQRKVHGK